MARSKIIGWRWNVSRSGPGYHCFALMQTEYDRGRDGISLCRRAHVYNLGASEIFSKMPDMARFVPCRRCLEDWERRVDFEIDNNKRSNYEKTGDAQGAR
jgi:hypothetical protein